MMKYLFLALTLATSLIISVTDPVFSSTAVKSLSHPSGPDTIGRLDPTPAIVSSCLVPGCNASQFIVDAIQTAKTEIHGQSYNFTDKDIATALIQMKHTGVDVSILVDKTTPCEKNSVVDMLVSAGISVAIDKHPRIAHNKVFVIDKQKTIEGSFNFSGNAMHNAENTNLVDSNVVAEWYSAQWDRRLAVSTPYVKREDWCKSNPTPTSD